MTSNDAPKVVVLTCPFCGEPPRFYGAEDGSNFESIDCINDDCEFNPTTGYMDYDEAIALWNTRASQPAEAGRVSVKPLVWEKSHMSSWNDDWNTVPTGYSVRCADEN